MHIHMTTAATIKHAVQLSELRSALDKSFAADARAERREVTVPPISRVLFSSSSARHGKWMFLLDPASSVGEVSAIIVTPPCRCAESSNGATSLAERTQDRLSTGSASDQTEARDSTNWAAGKNSCKHLKQDHRPTATSPGCLAHQHLLQNK